MKALTTRLSTDAINKLAIYLKARLAAGADSRDLVAMLEASLKDLLGAAAAHEAAVEAMIVALAMRNAADDKADGVCRSLLFAFRELEPKPGPITKRYLPKGLPGLIGVPVGEQPAEMRVVAGAIATDEHPKIAGFASALEDAADTLADKEQAYQVAVELVALQYAAELTARASFARQYERIYAELLARFGKHKAESFFKKEPKRAKKQPQA